MDMTRWRQNKWLQKVLELFRQGLTPKELALSISVGALVGVLPLFGVSTIITTALAIRLKFNLPLALFFTYAVGPIHLLLFIPFIRIGESIYHIKHELLSIDTIRSAFRADYMEAIKDLGLELTCGVTGWSIAAIPAAFVLYLLIRIIISFSCGFYSSKARKA